MVQLKTTTSSAHFICGETIILDPAFATDNNLAYWGVPGFIACSDNRLLYHVSAFVVSMSSHTPGGFL